MMIRRLLPILVALMAVFAAVAPSASAVPSSSYTPSVQLCDGSNGTPAHNSSYWHPLVVTHPDGSFWCTYGHEHGDNPRGSTPAQQQELDLRFDHNTVLPPMPLLAQTISYPWSTLSSSDVAENGTDNKHRAYHWLVGTWLGCDPTAPDALGIYDFRLEAHMDGNMGVLSRFHSYFLQAMTLDCTTGNWGTVQLGGHIDAPIVLVGPSHGTRVQRNDDPLSSCPISNDSIGENSTTAFSANRGVWYLNNQRPPNQGCDGNLYTTPTYPNGQPNETSPAYGFAPKVQIQSNWGIDSFGPVDPAAPGVIHLFDSSLRPQHLGTVFGTDSIQLQLSGWHSYFTNYNGHYFGNIQACLDRHGNMVSSGLCSIVDVDHVNFIWYGWAMSGANPDLVKAQAYVFPADHSVVHDGDQSQQFGYPRGALVKDPVTQ